MKQNIDKNSDSEYEILEWLNEVKTSSEFKVENIKLSQATDWAYEDGKIHHSSNRFFNVVGVKFVYPDGNRVRVPLLEQREIGTLGYIWRKAGSTPQLLIHAKIEPGNVGVVQIAPSCQATESNADRVHGGEISPYSDIFENKQVNIISSTLQSEQGSRFLGKLNRNILATLKLAQETNGEIHRWSNVDDVLKLLTKDYILNTDSRSVLVCSDWKELVARKPFSSQDTVFGNELSSSYDENGTVDSTDKLKTRISKEREKVGKPILIPLSELPDHEINEWGLEPKANAPFKVKYIKVKTKYREVKEWNQPIIESLGPGRVDFICARKDGILHFLLKPVIEPGLVHKVELGPSLVIEPGESTSKTAQEGDGKVLVQSWQSDEGGRFFQDRSLCRLVDHGEVYKVPEGWTWLSLKQIKELLDEEGWLTNEARSALSLLLVWL